MGTWRYAELLPEGLGEPVTMHEGGTSLLSARRVADRAGLQNVWIKVEGENPTGSFKDRGMTVGVSRAMSRGHPRVVCASTGNTAASMAAYAARAGLEAVVIVPSGGVARGKLAQAVAHGARIVTLRGSFDDAMRIVREGAARLGAHVLNSINPYRIEGQKTAAFEVWEQLGGAFPDWLVCPSGNGGNLTAYAKGFSELLRANAKGPPPRLASVQAEGAAPIARAILDGRALRPVARPETMASAIRIGNPANGVRTIRAVKDSGGTVNVCARSDAQYALGEGVSAFQKAINHGMRPGFSIDNEVSYGTDMFTEMRVAFNIQRAMATYRKANGDAKAPALIGVREVLECATVGGAACAGLLNTCGALTPGKEADIVMIRTDDINLYPSNHAVGTVVAAADVRNIDTVIIGGKVRKLRGKMMGVNMERFRRLADESRNYLFSKAGYKLDIFSKP